MNAEVPLARGSQAVALGAAAAADRRYTWKLLLHIY